MGAKNHLKLIKIRVSYIVCSFVILTCRKPAVKHYFETMYLALQPVIDRTTGTDSYRPKILIYKAL